MTEIENKIPLLTIFVPELPENSFSAEIWDTQDEIPSVAISIKTTNDVPIIFNEGEDFILKAGYIPSFPVVVIKENERVAVSSEKNANVKCSILKKSGTSLDFRFLDNVFDGSLQSDKNDENITKGSVHSWLTHFKIKKAYNIYKNVDGWQRDYVYYDLEPNNLKGPFSYDFQEHITTFSMKGTGANAMDSYNKISDQQGDPKYEWAKKASSSGWIGGSYEFKVKTLINAKNGAGSE